MELLEGTRVELEKRAAQELAEELMRCAKKKDAVLAIPGGRSVAGIFKYLARLDVPWRNIHVFMVDERFVPLESELSNYHLAHQHFLGQLIRTQKLPKENVHPFTFQSGRKLQALEDYEKLLKRYGGVFDVVLLSGGEDGHVAALYPEHSSVRNSHNGFIRISDSPKPPNDRMTASAGLIKKSGLGIVVFFGEEKDEAFMQFSDPTVSERACPAKLITFCREHIVFHTTS